MTTTTVVNFYVKSTWVTGEERKWGLTMVFYLIDRVILFVTSEFFTIDIGLGHQL